SRRSSKVIPIRPVILGRIEFYQDFNTINTKSPITETKRSDLSSLLRNCHGVGISGPNEFSDSSLRYFSKQKKIRAIHSAETEQSNALSAKITGKSETRRALLAKPDFLVHMTHASKKDLQLVSKSKASIVVCPRANGDLAEGIPDVSLMLETGCNVAIGTDNVMINSPDMFKEMDYLWKFSMGMKKQRLCTKRILKMATVNSSDLLGGKVGIIQVNNKVDGII